MYALRAQLGIEPALDKYEIRVSLMSWPLANHDTLGAELKEYLGDCANENGIRVHVDAWDVLDCRVDPT